jgi:hypothetical protein
MTASPRCASLASSPRPDASHHAAGPVTTGPAGNGRHLSAKMRFGPQPMATAGTWRGHEPGIIAPARLPSDEPVQPVRPLTPPDHRLPGPGLFRICALLCATEAPSAWAGRICTHPVLLGRGRLLVQAGGCPQFPPNGRRPGMPSRGSLRRCARSHRWRTATATRTSDVSARLLSVSWAYTDNARHRRLVTA